MRRSSKCRPVVGVSWIDVWIKSYINHITCLESQSLPCFRVAGGMWTNVMLYKLHTCTVVISLQMVSLNMFLIIKKSVYVPLLFIVLVLWASGRSFLLKADNERRAAARAPTGNKHLSERRSGEQRPSVRCFCRSRRGRRVVHGAISVLKLVTRPSSASLSLRIGCHALSGPRPIVYTILIWVNRHRHVVGVWILNPSWGGAGPCSFKCQPSSGGGRRPVKSPDSQERWWASEWSDRCPSSTPGIWPSGKS